jgi:hypothetical protein
MRIEVLYVPGCPNFQPAVKRIEKVLVSESLQADIEGVPVNSDAEAKALQFPGSPTIRINGNDVEFIETKSPVWLVGCTQIAVVFRQRKC